VKSEKLNKKNFITKLRAIGILASIRAVLKGEYDYQLECFIDRINGDMIKQITFDFKLNLLPSDITLIQNLSDEKIQAILTDAAKFMDEHCEFWNTNWWEKLGTKKPSKSDRGNGEKV